MASYPGALKSFTTKTNNVTTVLAADCNELQDEVAAIETELGVNVKKRLPKALANFDGSTSPPTMNASYNFSSTITDNGAGDYTLTFTSALSSANGVVTAMAGASGKSDMIVAGRDGTSILSTTTVRVQCMQTNLSELDSTQVMVVVYGDF